MTNLFLKAKHWQLFLLTLGIPMIYQIVMMVNLFSSMNSRGEPDPELILDHSIGVAYGIIMILFAGVLFGCFWAIAIGLQSKVPAGIKMKVKNFKIFFFTPLLYILFVLATVAIFFSNAAFNPSILFIIMPMHFFSMFCMFYTLYFVAKTFKTVELQREVNFSDFAGEFFMIWFYPIGIWIIQPKINKMVEE